MSVKIRPIQQSDKKIMTPKAIEAAIISSPMTALDKASNLPHTVVSSTIFGRDSHHDDPNESDKIYEDKYTRTGYVDLIQPVLNPFLAGRDAPVWRKILGLTKNQITEIINAQMLFDLVENDFISTKTIGEQIFDRERYIYGANLLCYLLDNVDLNKRLKDLLIEEFILPCMNFKELQAFKNGDFNVGEIVEFDPVDIFDGGQPIDGWFYGNFVLDLETSDFGSGIKPDTGYSRRDEIYSALSDLTFERGTNDVNQFPVIDIILNLQRNGVDSLKSQILDFVFVLPYGFRPTIDGRVDAITSQYNKMVNANLELRDILDRKDPTTYTVTNKYRELVQYIRNIFIGDDAIIQSQRLKDYKSISDTITGKTGLMRNRMQGARVDYSGRTVITCDPNMDIDMIGVPIKMLEKIAEPAVIRDLRNYNPTNAKVGPFKYKNLSTFSSTSNKDRDGITFGEYVKMWFSNGGKYDRLGAIGRQPTLFYLGIQGFRIKPVEGDAIVLSPLVVMPFNADFDGDQMHFNMPITREGQREMRKRMLFKNNIRYPKNGEVTVVTRHEIIYGLWVCKDKENMQGRELSADQVMQLTADLPGCDGSGFLYSVYQGVCKQRINVYDKINGKRGVRSAGVIALEYAVFGSGQNSSVDFSSPDFKVKAKTLTQIAIDYYGSNREGFLHAINRMVHLGFAVAKIWPPNISTIIDPAIQQTIAQKINAFNEHILEREEFVNIGIETEDEFSAYFNDEWKHLENEIGEYLTNNLSMDNGYVSMWKSGAKGNLSNIMQIFGLKGRVQKNDLAAFNSIVTDSYSKQLTGLEHFITAYGSRTGIADKVLATAEPGYMSRKLEHAGSIMTITWDDCGTSQGIDFTLADIIPFIDEAQISKFGIYPDVNASPDDVQIFWSKAETRIQFDAAVNYLAKIIVGRYIVLKDDEGNAVSFNYMSDELTARHYIKQAWDGKDEESGVITMRSVIYCDCPCCRVCYGVDIAHGNNLPEIGEPIGFIAAQAIGEPGTQLTMKNFQKGGVVSEANLTSSFELIEDYLELHDFSKKRRNKRGIISYDRLSPVEGYVKEQYLGNGGKRILVTRTADENDRKNLIPGTTKIVVHENTRLKEYVRVGDSFQKIQGDLNMKEVLRYRGFDKAASYLSLTLYSIFSTQDVAFKHFETIVAAMSCMQLLADAKHRTEFESRIPYGKGSEFRTGSILTLPESKYGVEFGAGVRTLIGLKNLPKFKMDFFESILMENMDSYIPRAILMNPNDSMVNPITRTAFGLRIGIGSDLEERRR